MPATKWRFYDLGKKYLSDGTFDMDDGTNWKLALFLSTTNATTWALGTPIYGNLTNEHANGNGYTTGGVALTNVTLNHSAGTVTFNCDPAVFTASGGSIVCRYGTIYKNATVNGVVKPLLCTCMLDVTNITVTDTNTLTITMNVSGIFTISGGDVD